MSTYEGIVDGLDEAEYHSHDALSQSQLKTLLESPARFAYEREHGRAHRAAFDTGHALHTAVLGEGAEVAVIDAPDWRTKAAREARDEARAAGKTPMLQAEADKVAAMRDAVMAHPAARVILEAPGAVEQSMFWTDEDTGINLRGRVDKAPTLATGAHALVDLKSTVSAAPESFAKSVWNFGYHIQRAVYVAGWEAITGELCEFVLIAVEKEPPYLTAVYTLDETAAYAGHRDFREALDLYLRCTESGEWPGYSPEIETLPSPRWAS